MLYPEGRHDQGYPTSYTKTDPAGGNAEPLYPDASWVLVNVHFMGPGIRDVTAQFQLPHVPNMGHEFQDLILEGAEMGEIYRVVHVEPKCDANGVYHVKAVYTGKRYPCFNLYPLRGEIIYHLN